MRGGGPLAGVKVVEMVGLGPGPFAGMLLADLGADVVRVDRPNAEPARGALGRGKRTVVVDLKASDGSGRDAVLRLTDRADAFIDVFRPGVAERLGIGPDAVHARNPRLIYGRLTGYGQTGPYADKAGHDLDYLALAGALEPLGPPEKPIAPINVLADFAGGGMLLALGIAAALHAGAERQVVDAAMVDGAALLLAPFYAGRASGGWGPRGTNMLDGAAPFYDTYAAQDGKWLAVGAIEPQFYAALLKGLGMDDEDPARQWDRDEWPATKQRFAQRIATRTRDEWVTTFDGLDACVAPVLDPVEATAHPHATARAQFFTDDSGHPQPAPAPRFSTTPTSTPAPAVDTDLATVLADWSN
jgi:alpha-methylacyl-CoA racemase